MNTQLYMYDYCILRLDTYRYQYYRSRDQTLIIKFKNKQFVIKIPLLLFRFI